MTYINELIKKYIVEPVAKELFTGQYMIDRLNTYMNRVNEENSHKPLFFAGRLLYDISFSDISDRV